MSTDDLLERKLSELRAGLERLERSAVKDLPTLNTALDAACEAADELREVQRERAELRESNERYRILANAILDSAIDGIITFDEDGIVGASNPAATTMFGYGTGELIGRNVTELLSEPHRERVKGYFHGEGVVGSRRELSGLHKDGSTFPMEISVSEVSPGEHRFFTAVVRDIREQVETERELRRERDFAESLVETAPTIVLVLDPEGRIARFNSYMERVSGYRLSEVRGKDWFSTFLPDDERPRVSGVFQKTVFGVDTCGTINSILTKDGTLREIEWSNSVLTDARGEVQGILAVGQDVTDKKELRAKLANAERLAAIGELAAGVAHEINNPINTIINCAELIAEGDMDPSLCADILHEGKRITSIVRGLLDFSREPDPGLTYTNAAAVVTDTLALIGRRIERSGIDVETGIPPGLPPIRGSHGQLQQVLLNLLLNARDALIACGKPGRKLITVSADRCAGEAGVPSLRIAVRDNGPGIAPQFLEKIFDPFYTTKRDSGGTGLGLSVSHGIVQSHGGSLRAASSPGKFTELAIELPTLQPGSEETDGPDRPD